MKCNMTQAVNESGERKGVGEAGGEGGVWLADDWGGL